MRKVLTILLSVVILAIAVSCAGAEAKDLFDQINGQTFDFASGVGGWNTELTVGENGSFTGNFHDSEMGETGDDYPNGTVYGCSFHGQFTDPLMTDEYTWTVKIAVEMDEGQVPEAIEDGTRYVTSAPYGVEKAQTVTVFLPGMPVDRLPEGFLFWSHLQEIAPDAKTIPYYAIWSEADEAGFISGFVSEPSDISGLEETSGFSSDIKGEIKNGAYVLSVKQNRSGEWHADEMAQDNSVVKLDAVGTDNGLFTARYEPAGDGEVTVTLRHFSEHNTCDEIHTFDLMVKDGKVQEETGGSYTASPDEADLNPFFAGEWLETNTQFTMLDVTKNPGDGWNVVITSPVSHGAWVIRATAYHDCDYDAFVYADGVKYDLIPGEQTQEKELETGLWGTLKFSGTADNPQLVWYDMNHSENTTVKFERAPGLPAYVYSGNDPIEGAAANHMAADSRAAQYLTEPGYVTIPCPIIHKTETIDDTHVKVYGSFWILNYVKRNDILVNISGGEYAGIMTLEKVNDEWRVTAMEEAGDGDDYSADIMRFAAGDKKLEEQFFFGADLGSEANQSIRTRFVKEYVETNNLSIAAYQDYGWDPVPLN